MKSQNSAATQQTAAAAQQLSTQAETLRASVFKLVRTVSGTGSNETSAPRTAVEHAPRGHGTPMKATGTDGLPSEDDPRFNDV